MRYHFVRDDKVEFVGIMKAGSDHDAIRQATEMLGKRKSGTFDRFEVWDGRRLVYRYPEPAEPPQAA